MVEDFYDDGISYFEIKSVGAGTISLSYDKYQILGELEALQRSNAGRQGRAILTFVTLGGTIPGPSVIKEATSRNVSLWNIWALEEVVNGVGTGRIAFSGAFPIYSAQRKAKIPIPKGLPWVAATNPVELPIPR